MLLHNLLSMMWWGRSKCYSLRLCKSGCSHHWTKKIFSSSLLSMLLLYEFGADSCSLKLGNGYLQHKLGSHWQKWSEIEMFIQIPHSMNSNLVLHLAI